MKSNTRFIAEGAMVAALYVILTYISMTLGLDKGAIQCRLSEALTVLPVFFSSAVPGLFVGCVLSNLLTGCAIWDIVFGSLATLVAAIITSRIKKHKFLAPIPAIVANTVVVPPVLAYVYHVETALPLIALTVFIGEVISCGVFGSVVIYFLKKHKKR
ncbi:MAG: QueT transporter family protein [Ruminococcaceae bacterium]|nr:QueT transporter family protein [Oscillospiraceae bacterium]